MSSVQLCEAVSNSYYPRQVLREMFQNLGFGEVTNEDLQILVETGDVDQVGKRGSGSSVLSCAQFPQHPEHTVTNLVHSIPNS